MDLLRRFAGLETEYAVRFTPEAGRPRPSNLVIYQAITRAVRGMVHTTPGRSPAAHHQLFTENGGALSYEALPQAPDGGLVEGATPECRGPTQLLLYQRAQDAMLAAACRDAEQALADEGQPGELSLLKNCRDAEGNVYGAQENYEAELASGPLLGLYRAGVALLVPVATVSAIALFAVVIAVLTLTFLLALAASIVGLFVPPLRGSLERVFAAEGIDPAALRAFGQAGYWIEIVVLGPVYTLFGQLLRLVAFRAIRRQAMAFLISRPVISGAGTLEEDGSFVLSEKGGSIRKTMRTNAVPSARGIFDPGNLMKRLLGLVFRDPHGVALLFRRRQRLQLGLSDSNCAQVAEYLKIGTTNLVLDLVEAGRLGDAPRPLRPVAALKRLIADPTLRAAIPVAGGGSRTALELQRYYLERAEAAVAEGPTVSMEARDVIRLWREALDALERDPTPLVGRLDWVTKRYLLESAGRQAEPAPHAALKKIDLRYHELGGGYLARLEAAGEAPTLVSRVDVERAIREAPGDTRAFFRGQLVRELAASGARAVVSWDTVKVGGPLGGEVIRLSDRRPPPDEPDA